jgi:hypothetical protein
MTCRKLFRLFSSHHVGLLMLAECECEHGIHHHSPTSALSSGDGNLQESTTALLWLLIHSSS